MPRPAPPDRAPTADLGSPDLARRRAALRALGEAPAEARAHVPALLAAMNDADQEVRWRAEFALGRVGREGVAAVAQGLRHQDASIRRAAAYVLGPMGPRAAAAVPALLETASDPSAEVRVWSVMALGLVAPRAPGVVPVLARALGDGEADVVRVALRIVIKLGPEAKDVIPALTKVLRHPSAELRWLSCIGFRQMGAEATAAAPAIAALLDDPDADVRSRSAQALGRIGRGAIPAVEAAAKVPARRAAAREVLAVIDAAPSAGAPASAQQSPPDPRAAERARWYNDAKFGMFIHWGLYSVPARARPGQLAEWVMDNEKIPDAEYAKFAAKFTAERFDPEEWVRIARDAGMRYMVLTSKHHDGFSLFDSQLSDYTAAKSAAAKRDVVGPLASAAEEGGLKFALYYSLLDWHHPDYAANFPRYVDWMHAHLREVLTRYPIWGLWFDGEWTHSAAEWRAQDILALARQLRPLAFVNDRLGRETRSSILGVDFYTKEQEIPPASLRVAGRPAAWETCQTFGYSWGYNESPDPLRSGERLIEEMVEVVSKGGNFLLNIGPRPDGTIPEWFQARLAVIGRWMKKNGEAIYGTRRSPFPAPLPAGRVTAKGDRLFVFLQDLPPGGIALPAMPAKVRRAYVLENGQPLAVTAGATGTTIAAPPALLDPTFTVVAVELDRAVGGE